MMGQKVGVLRRLEAGLFAAVCVREVKRPPEYRDLSFARDYAQTERMFRRFDGRVPLDGLSVLDLGCGRGPTCVYAALGGATRVVGVDINGDHVDYAREKVRRDHADLADRITFVLTDGRLSELEGEKFDLIISQNSFEHYSDPDQVVADATGALRRTGRLLITFSPAWKAPGGGHLGIAWFPWAHLIFSEDVVMAQRRKLIPDEQVRTYEECGVNRMTLERFRRIMNRSGLDCMFFSTNISEHPAVKVMRLASRIPLCEEYFTQNVYSLWGHAPRP
jgi:SAM-dependent methyltransferase